MIKDDGIHLTEQDVEGLDPLELMGQEMKRRKDELVTERAPIEARWVQDYAQYHGKYDDQTEKKLTKAKRSTIFVNVTRPKTLIGEAQLTDMLFPNDEKNWGIKPTPVPELANALGSKTPADVDGSGQEYEYADTGEVVTEGDAAQTELEQAKKRAADMEQEIADQLIECDYNSTARKALHYATMLGTGILCGPEVEARAKRRWVQGENGQTLQVSVDATPRVRHVYPWDFFPDMSAATIEESDAIFERGHMTKKQLSKLRRRPGFISANIARVLMETPVSTQSSSEYVDQIRALAGMKTGIRDNRYEVWTYHGPVSREMLELAFDNAGVDKDLLEDETVAEFDGVVVFCGEHILKATINPMESEDWPYSVFNWVEDDTCIFGFGIPYLARNSQRIINTSWRMMLDNAGRSAGPQIVRNRKVVQPNNGDETIEPWKLWDMTSNTASVPNAFGVFNFDNNQATIERIFQLGKQLLDEEVGLPMIAQGEQGEITPTLGGMSMLMNAANTDRRRQVKSWDDDVTKPLIRRFYDWNMQFSENEDIKGDMEVEARGTSALLIRETQAQNLMMLIDKYSNNPNIGPLLKMAQALRKSVQSLHLAPDDVIKDDNTIQAEADRAAEQGQANPALELEQLKAQNDKELENIRTEAKRQQSELDNAVKIELGRMELAKAEMAMNTEIIALAQAKDLKIEEIAARMKEVGMKMDWDVSKFKAETALKQQGGPEYNFGLE